MTTSCRASGSDSTAPSPRRWPTRGPGSGAIAAGHWGELAYHWSAARDDRRAFEASVRAGDAAARAFAFADARRHDERALESGRWSTTAETLAGIDRVDLLGRAAEAAWLSGDARRAVALRREAVATLGADADPIRLGGALERLGRALWVNTETEAALEAHEAAMAIMPTDPPTPELARVLSGYGQILMLLDRWTESLVLCERAVAIARAGRGPPGRGPRPEYARARPVGRGPLRRGSASLDAALAIAREVADADDIGRGYVNRRGVDAVLRRRARRGGGRPRGHRGDGRGRRLRTYGGFVRANGVVYAYELGDWAEANRLAEESVALVPTEASAASLWPGTMGPAARRKGDPRATSVLEELGGMVEGFPLETQFATPLRIAAPRPRCGAATRMPRSRRSRDGLDETRGHEWPRDHLRLYRVGMRAAADRGRGRPGAA